MHSRWFTSCVIVLWLSTMSWLISQKVIPPLLVGNPPSARAVVDARGREPLIRWEIAVNGRPTGLATTSSTALPGGDRQLLATVRLDEFPLSRSIAGQLGPLLAMADRSPVGGLGLDFRGVMIVDSTGRAKQFQSTVQVEPFREVITLRGRIERSRLKLTISAGELSYSDEFNVSPQTPMSDWLSPQSQLPGLKRDQTWTVPVYCPLMPPTTLMEILRATVERLETMTWNGRSEEVWLVVYRDESGKRASGQRAPRGRMWVRRDGAVLKQEATVLDMTVTFTRRGDDDFPAGSPFQPKP